VRVECESCRELVAASLAVEAGAVRASCPACGHITRAALAAPALASDAPLCPKCGAVRRPDAASCVTCGLAVVRMEAYSDARDAAVADVVRAAWDHAVEAWSEAARHDELLRLVAAHNGYAWAAGRYRTRPGDAIAARQLDRLRRAAEATMLASATARPDAAARPYRAAIGVLAVLIVVILVGVVYAVIRQPGATAAVPTAVPATPVQPLTPGHPVSPSTIR
jgi:predicted RNA-binding Zn-ribbon protein involved in translation (DUF1610 family)